MKRRFIPLIFIFAVIFILLFPCGCASNNNNVRGSTSSNQGAASMTEGDYDYILSMQETLDKFLAGEIPLNEHDLDEIENYISRFRTN